MSQDDSGSQFDVCSMLYGDVQIGGSIADMPSALALSNLGSILESSPRRPDPVPSLRG